MNGPSTLPKYTRYVIIINLFTYKIKIIKEIHDVLLFKLIVIDRDRIIKFGVDFTIVNRNDIIRLTNKNILIRIQLIFKIQNINFGN